MKQLSIEDVTPAQVKTGCGCPHWRFNFQHFEEQCSITGTMKMYERDSFNYYCDFDYAQCPHYLTHKEIP